MEIERIKLELEESAIVSVQIQGIWYEVLPIAFPEVQEKKVLLS